jgi:hypothetical protein
VVVIKLIMHKNYLPYSMILFNAVVELVLVIATLASAGDVASVSLTRLLVASSQERSTMRALLGVAVGTNYISNIVYIVLFLKYVKPLIANPRQIDVISNIVVIVVGTLTNYRFCIIAFAHLSPKPHIHIENASRLTPVHYLAIASIFLDLLPLSACIVGLYN